MFLAVAKASLPVQHSLYMKKCAYTLLFLRGGMSEWVSLEEDQKHFRRSDKE